MAIHFQYEFNDGAKLTLTSEVFKGVSNCLMLNNYFIHHGKPVHTTTPLYDADKNENFAGKLAGAILRTFKELDIQADISEAVDEVNKIEVGDE